jgi:two-component system sporulation sensor kinase A
VTFFSDINHQLIEAVHDGVLLLDMEQRVLYASPHYLQILGYSSAEIQAHEALRRVVPEDHQALTAVFQRVVAAPGSLGETRYRARTKDGRVIHLHARGRAHAQGIPGLFEGPCVLVSVRDVSVEVEAQRELELRSAFNHDLVSNLRDGIMIVNFQQKPLYVSPAYAAFLGRTPEEVMAQSPSERVLPEDLPLIAETFKAAQRDGIAPPLLYRVRGAQGLRYIRGYPRILPQGFPGHEEPCVLIIANDCTEEEAAHRRLAEREGFLRTLVENLNDGILILNMDQIPVYVSASYARFMGASPESLMGQPVPDRVHPDDLEGIRQNFRAAVQGGKPEAVHYRLRSKEGLVHIKGYCRYLPKGFPGFDAPCVMVVGRDAAVEVAAEERLLESERFYRGVLERFDDVVAVLNTEGRFSYVSPSVEHMLGFKPEQLVGKDGFEMLLPEDRRQMQDAFKRSLETPSAGRESEFRLRDAFGKVRILAAVSNPAGPELGGALLVRFRDVTRARLSDEELLRSERLTLLSELLAGVSHELRNPLLAVSANAELLAGSPALNAEDRESAESIQSQVRRLRQLLDQALNPVPDPRPEPLEPQSLLEQALLQARRRFGPLAARVRCDIEAEPACGSILALPGRLQLALANVMLNALQAAPDEGARVALRAVPDHGGVLLSIVDNGPGAPNDSMSEIFDPFYTTRPTASGLGLSTAKRIVEAHQGRLWAVPAEPHGLAVHAWLPAARTEKP